MTQREIPAFENVPLEMKITLLPGSNFVRFYGDSKTDKMAASSGAKDVSMYIGDLQITTENGDIYEE